MWSEIVAPPRLSFSLEEGDEEKDVPRKDKMLLEESNNDDEVEDEFEFSRSNSIDYESSCCAADEVFSNGVMMTHKEKSSMKKHTRYMKLPPLPSSEMSSRSSKNKKSEEKKTESNNKSSSFWGFGRSKSLNNSDRKKKLTMCSLNPLILSRSHSTGSSSSSVPVSKSRHQSSSSRSVMMNMYPPRSSSSSSSYGNGHRVSPVLNVPNPVSLFTFGSFLRQKSTKN